MYLREIAAELSCQILGGVWFLLSGNAFISIIKLLSSFMVKMVLFIYYSWFRNPPKLQKYTEVYCKSEMYSQVYARKSNNAG